QLPKLKFIATRSAGYDHISLGAAYEKGVKVSRVPHYGTRTVAEYAFALMFSLSRNAFRSYTDVQRQSVVSDLSVYEGFDLCGKTLGVVGTGAIGENVCQIGRGLGMQVVAYDVHPKQGLEAEYQVTYLDLLEVAKVADILTVHVPSLPSTKKLINEDVLTNLKHGAYFINTARGDVVDTQALVKALKNGHLAGAGLDVLEGEHEMAEEAELLLHKEVNAELWQTLVANHALIDMPNVVVTPHIAFNTKEAKREITDITAANILAFVSGTLQNEVKA
ncbi:hydroxyacid dehydrogenase, partial [Candidatus Saccharibacteria bacterium]|nr:hydroxyacid dehydrogenase [Candidatus Saccharibacteria bacterium]